MKAGPIGRSVQAEGEEGLPRYGAPDMKYENTTLATGISGCRPGQDLDRKSSLRAETFINLPFKSSMDIFCQRIVWFCPSRSISVSTLMRSAYFN